MADDQLKNLVLDRAFDDKSLSEDARLVVLAALESDEDLAEVLAEGATRQATVQSLTAHAGEDAEPVGAYLRSITVQGFRGIGREVKVPLEPGPGLTVIAGRNGSGKSTLAEALELALTGRNLRWKDKAQVWSQHWRNLHHPDVATVRVGITEQGQGVTTIGVDWPSGSGAVTEHKAWVQRPGRKQEDRSALGWAAALELYRPLLGYDELSGILEGKPSEFHDSMERILGLEQLTDAIARLDRELKRLKQPSAELTATKKRIRDALVGVQDPRAAQVHKLVGRHAVEPEDLRPFVTSTEGAVPATWTSAAALTAPDRVEMLTLAAALRTTATSEAAMSVGVDRLSSQRIDLLEQAIRVHAEGGDGPCPVCATGTLDGSWAEQARIAVDAERKAGQGLSTARDTLRRARTAVLEAVAQVPAPPADPDLPALAAAAAAYQEWTAVPADGNLALADHLERHVDAVAEAFAAAAQEAAGLIRERADAWAPHATALAVWIEQAELMLATEPTRTVADEASKWLNANASDLRRERLAPLASRSQQIWSQLRQDSNVELAEIVLEGRNTQRRVTLRASVDGEAAEAFGVMSQGELHALALAVFLPRAAAAASPFRFLVLDDPIQAMDPSKVEGFLQVMTEFAKDRQVIVLTHDDRLPSAVRRSRVAARIIEVSRGARSEVQVNESTRPAQRMLDDAEAIAKDRAVPMDIKGFAVPALCRDALESTAHQIFVTRALADGSNIDAVERMWTEAKTTKQRLALALTLDRRGEPGGWLDKSGNRKAMMFAVTREVHEGASNPLASFESTRAALKDLRREFP
ncbi:AAA family ATPase [Nakamurella sp. YIM 132087]|uniref:Nuclease SbcCD subunit C n=1 Tax=Nakamurella alba TaxID=2665158 RepID=A0A7K1FPZ3_9ACTN|nr:AAA family ATPase [Nakamurella alba]MTD15419.1 AAA family ATPase [Nakamurella alba]